jgi:hypothetical protein
MFHDQTLSEFLVAIVGGDCWFRKFSFAQDAVALGAVASLFDGAETVAAFAD